MVRAESRRFRRRCHQGGTPRRRRRHPRLGPALAQGHGRQRHRRGRLLPGRQPQQALHHARHQYARGPGHRAPAGRPQRRGARELQSRPVEEIRARLRGAQGRQAGPGLLLHHRLRPDRPLRRARRLRLHRAGHGRLHEPHGRARRPARRRPAEGRRGHLGPDDRHVRHRRRAGRAGPPGPHRRGPVHRHGAARRAGRHAGQHEHQLPGQRPGAPALGQRAPEHRAVPDLPDRGRLDHRRRRQRRAVPPLRGRRRPARTGRRPALCHQPAARGQPRRAGADPGRHGPAPGQGRVDRAARSRRRALRPDQHARRGVRQRAGQGARPARRCPTRARAPCRWSAARSG